MRTSNFLPLAALAVASLATAADAATVSIRATILNGIYLGASVMGTLDYDEEEVFDENPDDSGDEDGLTSLFGSVKLFFSVGPIILTEMNDTGAPGFPRVTFIDGVLDDINYEVRHGVNGADLQAYGVLSFKFGDLAKSDLEDTYDVGVEVEYGDASVVPLPAGLPLLGGGLALLAAVRRKRRA